MPPFDNWKGFKDIEPPLPQWEPNPDPSSIVVPGLDTSASLNDQIDQMDQLITIKLQNIDANFQKIQDIMANRILPAFRKYAQSTEPVREAARFWLSFYEAAAKTSMPPITETGEATYEPSEIGATDTAGADSDGASETAELNEVVDENISRHESDTTFNPNATPSFSHHAAVSSTPLHPPSRGTSVMFNESSDMETVDSIAASMETPIQRLGRQIQSLDLELNSPEDHRMFPTPAAVFHASRTPASTQGNKAKGKAAASNLREGVLRQNMSRSSVATPKRNPFHPKSVRKWNGIVDLVTSPGVPRFSPGYQRDAYDEEVTADSDDIWPPGMSPLQTVRLDIPGVPKPSPRKPQESSRKIKDALLANVAAARNASYMSQGVFRDTSSNFTSTTEVSTPSLSGLKWHYDHATESPSSIPSLPPLNNGRVHQVQQKPSQRLLDPPLRVNDGGDEYNSDDDDDTQTGGAFDILARRVQESTGDSDSDDSDDGAINPAFANIPTVDDGDDSFDDSFDDRHGTGSGTNLFGPRGSDANHFALRGQGLLDDTLGVGQVLQSRARTGAVEGTPTPYGAPPSS